MINTPGKERPEHRVRDAVRSLQDLRLGYEVEEVDLQNSHHHVIFLGDLNFRVSEKALQRILMISLMRGSLGFPRSLM
jgi:hypothetical protein